ncbi:MAG: hypothetical protein U5N26_11170 [Candidatus Marinimicrobia bacterium]|nr:hypothetical protein [Candidatus Neomarinimicrobiota bacterium]
MNNIYSTNHDFSGETPAVQTEDFNFKQCAFYDGKLYVSSVYTGSDTLRSNEKAIMAYPANGDGSLGAPETVINWTEDFAGSVISGITFDADGKMYVATQTRTPVYVIDPVGGTYDGGDISLLYPVLLDQKIVSMNWESGGYMAYIGEDSEGTRNIFRLKMLPQPSPSYIP